MTVGDQDADVTAAQLMLSSWAGALITSVVGETVFL